jgi:hypothetical protein
VSNELIVSALGPLVGALIGAAAALLGQRQQWKLDRKADGETESKVAVQELAVRAQSLDMASHQAAAIGVTFASLGGQLNRLIGIVTPLDPPAIFDDMNVHFEGLNRAAAQLRMSGDQETVRLTNAVMAAAASVIEAHHAALPSRWLLLREFIGLFTGTKLRNQAAIDDARTRLADAVRDLVAHTRRTLSLSPVDLYAVPEATHTLAAEQTRSPASSVR